MWLKNPEGFLNYNYIFKTLIQLNIMVYPIMYRVFLQDEKDAPNPDENPLYKFRIRSGRKHAFPYDYPLGYKPSIKEQLKTMNNGFCIGYSSESLDKHWLIEMNDFSIGNVTIGIVHSIKEIPDRTYFLAKEKAQELADYLSEQQKKPYIFIDLTSRGDKDLAEKLAQEIYDS